MPSRVSDWVAGAIKARESNTMFSIFNGKATESDRNFLWKEECFKQPKKQECNLYAMDVDKSKFKAHQSQADSKCYHCGGDHFKHNCPDLNRGQLTNQKSNSHKPKIKELKAEVEKLKKEDNGNGNDTTGMPSSEKDI
ncbi:hypothetical protein V8B97DRAFT_1873547 [Scleroderma yunnanense]